MFINRIFLLRFEIFLQARQCIYKPVYTIILKLYSGKQVVGHNNTNPNF